MDIKLEKVPPGENYVSTVAFVVGKVDSPAMVDSNVRVVFNGAISIKGRVEVKMREQWTTVVKHSDAAVNGNNAKAACR